MRYRLVLCLSPFAVLLSLISPGTDGIICYFGSNCLSATPNDESFPSIESCCVGRQAGERYRHDDSDEICSPCVVYGFGDSEESTEVLSEVTLPEGGSLNLTFKPFKNTVQTQRLIEISSTPFAGTSSSGYSVQSGDSRSNDSIVIRLTAQNDRFTVVITAESDDIAAEVSKGFELTASLKIGSLLENEFTLPLRVNITDDDEPVSPTPSPTPSPSAAPNTSTSSTSSPTQPPSTEVPTTDTTSTITSPATTVTENTASSSMETDADVPVLSTAITATIAVIGSLLFVAVVSITIATIVGIIIKNREVSYVIKDKEPVRP